MNVTAPLRHDRSTTPSTHGPQRIDPEHPLVPEQSRNGAAVALSEMSVPQLAEAAHGLDRLEHEYENMSGICATLKGGVFAEVKAKLPHGEYRPWLAKNFPKSAKTAERYKRLWDAFSKSDSTVAFAALTHDLAASVAALKQFQLDLSHPVVAKVAEWVAGRGAYQLMLDFPGENKGGAAGRKKLTPAEQHAQFLEDAKNDFANIIQGLDGLVIDGRWKAPTITDAMLEASIDLAREYARQASAFLKTPKKDRHFAQEQTEGAES